MAGRLGIRSKLDPNCSLTLGSDAVNPLEMTNAYATLADQGVRNYATPLIGVTGPHNGAVTKLDGNTNVNQRGKQVLDPNDANLVTSALTGVVDFGTGTAADIGRPVAGKTGTAQKYVDAWFCGYLAPPADDVVVRGYDTAPQLVTCVWMGYPKGEIPMDSVEGVAPVYGGTIPAAIWHDYMTAAVTELGIPSTDFPKPSLAGYDKGPISSVAPPTTPSTGPTTAPSSTEGPSPTDEPSPTDDPSPTDSPSPSDSPSSAPSRGLRRGS
jgi:penicillin-binding protein 1A